MWRTELPDTRLITLTGPGGIGKTRLAIETASHCRTVFLHGVCFVPLAALQSADLLAATIADSLKLPLSGNENAREELIDALRNREILLILDNFERLIDKGAALLSEILQRTEQVKMLVTSRERLGLRAERLFNVEGLSIPAKQDPARAAEYSAVQLFLQNARYLQRNFTPLPGEMQRIVRICQLVDGMPLGIELAAAWTQTLSCREITTELEESTEFLSAQWQDIPRRHRSLNAVFEQSWKRLSASKQNVLQRLSVFRGGFNRLAAEQVAGASLSELTALINKSFVKKISEDRYDLHEMIRQFAAKKLAENKQAKDKAESLHSLYYANFLRRREESWRGNQQQAALAETEIELGNIRTMWQWVIAHRAVNIITLALDSLYLFFWASNRFQEGLEALEQAETVVLADNELLLAKIWTRQSEFLSWLGDYEKAETLLKQSINVLQAQPPRKELAVVFEVLGRVEYLQGKFDSANRRYRQSLAISRECNYQYGVALALNGLANALCDELADYKQAQSLLEESLTISRQLQDGYGEARAIINLGATAQDLKDYRRAKQLYQESLIIYKELGYRYGISAALNYLGQVTYLLGEYQTARDFIEESLTYSQAIGYRIAIVRDLRELGNIAVAMGAYREAQARYIEAVQLACKADSLHQTLDTLLSATNFFIHTENREYALEILAFILQHSDLGQELELRAQNAFTEVAASLSAQTVERCRKSGAAKTLDQIAQEIALEKQ